MGKILSDTDLIEQIKTDVIGQELQINDYVLMKKPKTGSAELIIGTVIAFTPKKVKVKFVNNWCWPSKHEQVQVWISAPRSLFKIEKDNPKFVEYLLKQ